MSEAGNQQGESRGRHRSPSYPYMSLRECVKRAESVWNSQRRNKVGVAAAVKDLGYSSINGTALMSLAALIKFGLMDDEGAKENRLVWLTERAVIIIGSAPDSAVRKQALRAAALSPEIHRELWERYQEHGLPSNEELTRVLKFDKQFNPNAIEGFIQQFRDTVAFAELTVRDSNEESAEVQGSLDEEKPPEPNPNEAQMNPPPANPQVMRQSPPPREDAAGAAGSSPHQPETLSITIGNRVLYTSKLPMTKKKFDKMLSLWEMFEDELVGEDAT